MIYLNQIKGNAFQIENIDNKIKQKDLNNESSSIVSNKFFIEALDEKKKK